ncbi:MAG TPA: BTAD domain-containing putative transcriptional regulator [Acidimicrobiales bacterium]|nr:BTAD domain-containing putative transcriptional regulator [Acidimicrobiales bacterium]
MGRSPAGGSGRRRTDGVGTAASPALVRMLGSFELEVDDRSVPLGGLRQRAVLALLAIHLNDVVARDALIEDLWAGEPPASAVSTLQGYVSHLRRALAGSPIELASRGPGYVLVATDEQIDARRFVAAVGDAQQLLAQGRAAGAVEVLDRALALWRGPALADFTYEDFARPEAAHLDELRLAAISLRLEARLALGQHQAAAGELEELVLDHPLREDFRAQLMRALAAAGRRVEALRVYQDGRTILADVGLDPGVTLQRLERAILAQDPSLETQAVGAAAPDRLPVPMTSFVGRGEEITAVADLLRSRRLVTISGPGGIGKTRLSLEIARALAPEYPDGAYLVELASLSEGHLVAATVAGVLGIQVHPDGSLQETLAQAVGHRSCLIVLDNCEHVLEEAAAITSAILQSGPGPRVMATSRQPLGLAAETVWSAPTLNVPDPDAVASVHEALDSDAIRLFAERADTAWPGFCVNESNAEAVVRICQRLDGMPLAIELAAARLRSMGVEQLADRLDDRFRLLTTGDRAALPRHRTLEASVEWSHDLLSDEERALFRRMAVFSGLFDLGAVEAVCSSEPLRPGSVAGVCGELVDKSLLTRVNGPSGEPRYRMLETIRHFGLDRLAESGEEAELRAAHARAFSDRALQAVPGLHGPDTAVCVGQLDADRADIRAALEWLVTDGDPADGLRLATGLWLYWRYLDEPGEGRSWLDRAVARGDHGRAERLAAAVGSARLAIVANDIPAARLACEQGRSLLADADDWSRAHLVAVEAELLRFEGSDRVRAEELARDAVAAFNRCGDAYWEAHARRVLGQLAWDKGDLTRASALAGQYLHLFETCGDAEGMAGAKLMLAGLARDQGDSENATRLYEESLVGFRAIGQPGGQAEAARHFGTLVLAAGDDQRAEELGRESLRLCENLGLGRGVGQSCELLGRVAFERGQLDEAEELCERALKHLDAQGYPADVATVACTAGHVALHLGRLERASELLQAAIGPAHGFGYRRNPALALSFLARVRARHGDPGGASLAEEALNLARQAGDPRTTATSLEALAEAEMADDRAPQAARLMLVARYTRQAAGIEPTRVEQSDRDFAAAAVDSALADDEFGPAWRAAWASDVIDLVTLDALSAVPEAILGAPTTGWTGPERRLDQRRRSDRRQSAEDVVVSPTSDRRGADRRRWGRRRSDRVP